MHFSIINASVMSKALVNDILKDILKHFFFLYFDGILILPSAATEQISHVCQIL